MGIRAMFSKKGATERIADGGNVRGDGSAPSSRASTPPRSPQTASDSQSSFSSRSRTLSRQNSSNSDSSLFSAGSAPPTRVMYLENGRHRHQLRNTRRQEKLRRMLREVMGGATKRVGNDAISAVPDFVKQVDRTEKLTLMQGLVNKLSSGVPASKELDAPSFREDTFKSLVEKYGRCQEVIGRGSYGVVRVAHKTVAGKEQLYAVKEFHKRQGESVSSYQDRLMSEFCISSSLSHLNVNKTFDLMKDASGGCCQVMEYCAGGDLYSLVLSSGSGLHSTEADCFFKQILRGIVYMHSMGVAHCDIKPENILLTQNGVCKISDFGNGECFRMAWEKEIHFSRGVCGSGPYIAPEEYKGRSFDPRAVDIWALGVVYMVMRTGSYLWRKAVAEEDDHYARYLSDRKTERGFAPVERLAPSKSVYVVYSILDPVPTRRITGKQVLNSEWCRGIAVCDAAESKENKSCAEVPASSKSSSKSQTMTAKVMQEA